MSAIDDTSTEAGAVADVVARFMKPDLLDIGDGLEVLAVPEGMTIVSVKKYLDEYRTAPERRQGTATLKDLASFIAHANRFKDDSSALFGDRDVPSLVSVLDYHHEVPLDVTGETGETGASLIQERDRGPRFGTHRGVYLFPLSAEWKAWTAKSGMTMKQGDFAEFLEERIVDVADPAAPGSTARELAAALDLSFASPSRLLELSRGLTVHVDQRVTNAKNLSTGEGTLQFQTTHADESGAPLKVPSAFLVALPVFRDGALYQVAVRLRYRVQQGVIAWSYELHRAERALDHAFAEACDKAAADTSLPLYMGAPEKLP